LRVAHPECNMGKGTNSKEYFLEWESRYYEVANEIHHKVDWCDLSEQEQEIINNIVGIVERYCVPMERSTYPTEYFYRMKGKILGSFQSKWHLWTEHGLRSERHRRDWYLKFPFQKHEVWIAIQLASRKVRKYALVGVDLPDRRSNH